MGYLSGRIKILEVKVGRIIVSEFFNRGVLSKMDENKLEFVIAANYSKRIKEILEHHKNQTQNISTYPLQISHESVLFLSTCDYSKYEIWIFNFCVCYSTSFTVSHNRFWHSWWSWNWKSDWWIATQTWATQVSSFYWIKTIFSIF